MDDVCECLAPTPRYDPYTDTVDRVDCGGRVVGGDGPDGSDGNETQPQPNRAGGIGFHALPRWAERAVRAYVWLADLPERLRGRL